ncbi:hypothetical protein OH76DRAFT_500685 [Lentinus brumalis]|uniref:Uncharacterized protein n=1 Tax=Lentinus brumalis TaxID=2498619 RepID=A0A371DBM9_9APHY|nr:hypothetical protein OH76DRAFT_500685 [Polyporus brumalis]
MFRERRRGGRLARPGFLEHPHVELSSHFFHRGRPVSIVRCPESSIRPSPILANIAFLAVVFVALSCSFLVHIHVHIHIRAAEHCSGRYNPRIQALFLYLSLSLSLSLSPSHMWSRSHDLSVVLYPSISRLGISSVIVARLVSRDRVVGLSLGFVRCYVPVRWRHR